MAIKNQEKIKKSIKQVVKGYKPEKVYLFGSYAWGRPDTHSDVDLLIVKNSNLPRRFRISEAEKFFSNFPYPFDVLVYTPEEIEARKKLGDFFIKLILEKGKLLYEKR